MYLHMSFDLTPHLKGPYYRHGLGICCKIFTEESGDSQEATMLFNI